MFLEIPGTIESVTLQSEVSLEIANFDETLGEIADSSTPTGYQFSAKILFKKETNRFEVDFQTIEGQYGSLETVFTPSQQQLFKVQMKTFQIRPLSIHMRIHTLDQDRPFNSLSLKGSFSLAEIHNWLEQCIPEVPEKLCSANDVNELYFKNVLIGSVLECKYSKGNASFRSDNLTTISILKDFLTKEATKKRIKLEIIPQINNESISHILKLIAPKITDYLHIRKEHKFLKALEQVDIRNEEDFNCLMPEYQSILNRAVEIENAFKNVTTEISRYFGIITDFYIDCFKFKGIFAKDRVPYLLEVLDNFDLEKVISMFNGTSDLNEMSSSERNIEYI